MASPGKTPLEAHAEKWLTLNDQARKLFGPCFADDFADAILKRGPEVLANHPSVLEPPAPDSQEARVG